MRSTNLDLFSTDLLFRSLGLDRRVLEQNLGRLPAEPEHMRRLRDQFRRAAGRRPFDADRMGAKLRMPAPRASRCPCPHRYARDPLLPGRVPARIDLADLYGKKRRVKARKLERLLRKKPFVRQQVEMMLGGRILPDRKRNGKIRILPFAAGGFGGRRGRSARVAANKLRRMRRFKRTMLGGLAKVRRRQGRKGRNSVNAVLRDPALTVEDKVTLMIMLIMKKMDRNIEKQAKHINSLQQRQNGGGGGAGFQGNSPSIDVETMKLKRLIDKRSQMFDMLRQIIDKYNQTAKGIIDSIGR